MKLKLAKMIQEVLKAFGFYKGKIDGDFGKKSKNALKEYQKIHGLVDDGIWGRNTKKVMFGTKIWSRNRKPTKVGKLRKSNLTGTVYPNERDLVEYYGAVGKNQVRIKLPYKMYLAWDPRTSISSMLVHKKVAEDMKGIFKSVLKAYGRAEIKRLGLDMYGGCLNVRKIRGGSRWSTHSWGIAVDLDPVNNRLKWKKGKAKFSQPEYLKFWQIVEFHGATSLGRERNYDWMHFQFCSR